MDAETYFGQAERTERKLEDGIKMEPSMMTVDLVDTLVGAMVIGSTADTMKRHIIYDADAPAAGSKYEVAHKIYEKYVDTFSAAETNGLSIDQAGSENLHALLGLISELGELIEAMFDHVLGNAGECTLDIVNIGEELGDMDWYKGILVRRLGMNEGQLRAANIAKLKARYPEKFTSDDALNRSLDDERETLNEAIG